MPSTWYARLKDLLPGTLRHFLGTVNQRLFARHTLRWKYGNWFETDWRKKFRSLSDDEWKRAYNEAWRHHRNECVEETDEELFLRALKETGSVADIGCGQGALAIRLAREGYRVTGIDVSSEALDLARARARQKGVSVDWMEGFAEQLPLADKSVDYIVTAHTLEHVRDLDAVAREFQRVARKKIVILTPKQQFRMYMDNYHTQFFPEERQLTEAMGLRRFECREIDCSDHQNEFQGKAWFYVGHVDR